MSLPEIPSVAWRRRFDEEPPRRASPIKVTLKLLWEQIPTVLRINRQIQADKKQGKPTVLDPFRSIPFLPDKGVPLGGLGGGSITRGFRGDFNRWQLQPGVTSHACVLADQFSLFAQRSGEPPQAIVLNPRRPDSAHLDAWTWGLPAEKGAYHALFPRAWTVYEDPLPGLRLVCRQI